MRTKVFISYSHQDERWRQRLVVHLGSLERQDLVDSWSDTRIPPGSEWRAEIERAITQARIAVLLVSADFLNSAFIRQVELPAILGQAQRDGLAIVPLVVSPCLVEDEPWLAQLQSVNPPSRPLTAMTPNDQEQTLVTAARLLLALHRGLPAPVVEPEGTARLEQKLSTLRRQLLVASPVELRRLQYEVEELVTHFPVPEARELLEQVRHARVLTTAVAPVSTERAYLSQAKSRTVTISLLAGAMLPFLAFLLYRLFFLH